MRTSFFVRILLLLLLPFLAMVGFAGTGFAQVTMNDSHPPATSMLSGAGVDDASADQQEIPDGFHIEKQSRKGLAYLGAFTFGVPYLLSVVTVVAFVAERPAVDPSFHPLWLLVPVVGPFAMLPATKGASDFAVFFAVGAAEAVGVALIISSVIWPRTVLVRNQAAQVLLAPMRIGAAGNGIGLMGSF